MMSKSIIKKKQIPVIQIKEIFSQVKQYLPEWLLSPTLLVLFLVNFLNDITIVLCYSMLLGQTARMLANEQKYANIKVLMTKWTIFLFFQLIFSHINKNNVQGSILKGFFLLAVFAIIYPSDASRLIFQKYFKGQQSLKESCPMTDSFILNNNSLFQKFLVVLVVNLLKIAKYILTFINPLYRKSIQEEIKYINIVVAQQKFFWKTQSPKDPKDPKVPNNKFQQKDKETKKQVSIQSSLTAKIPQVQQKTAIHSPQIAQQSAVQFKQQLEKQLTRSIAQALQKQKEKENSMQNSTTLEMKGKQLSNSAFSIKNQSPVSKAKKYKKYSVSEYLPLFSTANRSSVYPNSSSKRCTYYREIEISYDVNSAVMTVTSLEDMKVSYHVLEEIVLLEELMVQFEFEGHEQVMVKFKSRNEFEEFITLIDMYESSLQK